MKIRIQLETTEAETFSALEKLEYFGDRIREAAALFQGKIIDETLSDFPWPPESRWKDADEDPDDDHADHDHDPGDDHDHEGSVYTDFEDEEVEENEDEEEAVFPHSGPVASSPADDADSDTGYWSSTVDSQYEWEKESSPVKDTRKNNMPKLSEEVRAGAWKSFEALVSLWAQNFDLPGDQPDRLEALRQAGTGRYTLPVLIMAYEFGSLQRMIEKALIRVGIGPLEDSEARLDYADKIAANMVQISHLTFPDLAGTYDYSTKWRR